MKKWKDPKHLARRTREHRPKVIYDRNNKEWQMEEEYDEPIPSEELGKIVVCPNDKTKALYLTTYEEGSIFKCPKCGKEWIEKI